MLSTIRSAFILLVSTLGGIATDSGVAQDFPNKTIRIIVANTAGGTVDVVPRLLAPAMSQALGQPVIIENKPGANGVIGFEHVLKDSPADGHTLLHIGIPEIGTLPIVVKNLRFDPVKDSVPIMLVSQGQYVFGSPAAVPWKTINEMVAYVKSRPGQFNYGTPAPSVEFPTEAILRGLGLDVVRIPYKGGVPYVQAVMANEVQMSFGTITSAKAMGEKFRPLAVTGDRRHASMPDVPTFAELGLVSVPPNYYVLLARSGTPKPIIDKLHAAASSALQRPEVKDQMAKFDLEVLNQPSDAATEKIAESIKFFAEQAIKIGFKPQ